MVINPSALVAVAASYLVCAILLAHGGRIPKHVVKHRLERWVPLYRGPYDSKRAKEAKVGIERIITYENPFRPFSDQAIAQKLEEHGVVIAQKAVEWHRQELGIPAYNERRRTAVKDSVEKLVEDEDLFNPLSNAEIVVQMQEMGVKVTGIAVAMYLHQSDVISAEKFRIMDLIADYVNAEPILAPHSDTKIADQLLKKHDVPLTGRAVAVYRNRRSILPAEERRVRAIKNKTVELVSDENPLKPYTDQELADLINTGLSGEEDKVSLDARSVERFRTQADILPVEKRRGAMAIKNKIAKLVNVENPFTPYTDQELTDMINAEITISPAKKDIPINKRVVRRYRTQAGIPPFEERGAIATIATKNKITELIGDEDPFNPRTDKELANIINTEISPGRKGRVLVSEWSVENHRKQLGILAVKERRNLALKDRMVKLIGDEDTFNPYTDKELANIISAEMAVSPGRKGRVLVSEWFVGNYRKQLGILAVKERRNLALKDRMVKLIGDEDTFNPYTDQKLSDLLAEDGIYLIERMVMVYRHQLGIPSFKKRQHGGGQMVAGTALFKPRQFESNAQLSDFFIENMEMLTTGNGIPAAEMAKAFNLPPAALGTRIGIIQKELVNEPEHFIHRIRSKPIMGIRYYSLPKQGQPDIREQVSTYFASNTAMLQVGHGIPAQEAAREFDISAQQLGQILVILKNELSGGHPVQTIKSKKLTQGGKSVTFYFLPPESEQLDYDIAAGD